MSHDKLKLLYIASNGRSGSTVLEMLLNVSPHLFTIGEFHVLPWEVRRNQSCGCGAEITGCELWGPIIREHKSTLLDGTIDRFRKAHNADRMLRPAELPALVSGRLRDGSKRFNEVRRYADDNETFLNAVSARAKHLEKPNLVWLVDASKSPYRLLWLAASQQFELKVIHLVKDPRAFAYSLSKHSSGMSRIYSVTRAAARWQLENRLFEMLSKRYLSRGQFMRVQYEQLAGQTEETLSELAGWLGILPWSGATNEFRSKNHGVAGNPARFESRGIELDEKWRRELPAKLQRLAFRCGWQLTSRYGYRAS
jgi:hypothetical protein